MCVPLVALALTAAGTVAKYIGAKQAERAKQSTYDAESARQKKMGDEQHAKFQESLDRTRQMLTPEDQAAAAAKREGGLAAAIVPQGADGAYMPGSSSAPAVVADATAAAGEKSAANAQSFARTLAALGATGDQMQGLNIGVGRNSQSIGQIGGFKAGSMGVLDSEMKAAAAKGSFLRGIGGLAQTIGSAWMGGAGGAPTAAGTAALTPDVTMTMNKFPGIF